MLWFVLAQRLPKAWWTLCPVQLWAACDVCPACQSITHSLFFFFCVQPCLAVSNPQSQHSDELDHSLQVNRHTGLAVKASALRAEDLEFETRLRRDISGLSHTSDLKIGTPVATLPGAWRYRVSAGTGWPGVSIPWLGEMESLICNFYLSVATRTIVWADPSLRYTRMLLEH